MKDKYTEKDKYKDAPIGVALQTLVDRISKTSRQELSALRVMLDKQISSVESRLEANNQSAIDAAVNAIVRVTSELIDQAREEAEAAVAEAKEQIEKAEDQLVEATARLKYSQHEIQELSAERARLRAEREHLSPKIAPPSPAPPRSAPSAYAASASVSPPKKPIQFFERARDARRVKIREGMHVIVDGIPGELADLSVGGAQTVLTQMVKPNQLVRLILPTAAGQLICRARIVWAVYEQPKTSLAVYRTGVKFIDADPSQVETFMNDFREQSFAQSRPS